MWGMRFWRRPRSERIKALRAEMKRLARELGNANAAVNRHEATIRTLNNAVQDWQRELALEQKLSAEYLRQRDEARRQAATYAAECTVKADQIRHLEASLSGVREELRQEQVERARAEQRAAVVTADELGAAMRRMSLPTQRDGGDA